MSQTKTYKVQKGWIVQVGEPPHALTWATMHRGWTLKNAVAWVQTQEMIAPEYEYRIEPEAP
jgi:DNA modification methylase